MCIRDSPHALFAVEPLPGQFDQRADSAAQCIQLMTQGERPAVRAAKVYLLMGSLSQAELDQIKRYLINPVECREAALDLPDTLRVSATSPAPVETISGFTGLDEAGLAALLDQLGLAMDLELSLIHISGQCDAHRRGGLRQHAGLQGWSVCGPHDPLSAVLCLIGRKNDNIKSGVISMGGFFGAVSHRDVTLDIFFGVDYHSHLGTRRGGMIIHDQADGFQRQIHSIENTPFRTKFEKDLSCLLYTSPLWAGITPYGCLWILWWSPSASPRTWRSSPMSFWGSGAG